MGYNANLHYTLIQYRQAKEEKVKRQVLDYLNYTINDKVSLYTLYDESLVTSAVPQTR